MSVSYRSLGWWPQLPRWWEPPAARSPWRWLGLASPVRGLATVLVAGAMLVSHYEAELTRYLVALRRK